MTDRDKFLKDILADPDNDSLRLVFAGFLEESGEDAHAEFIRVQVELATLPPQVGEGLTCLYCRRTSCRGCVLRRRELELLYSWGPCGRLTNHWYWAQPAEGIVENLSFHRGFVESITCTAADWLIHADAILAAHPVREVTLTTWPIFFIHWNGEANLRNRSYRVDLRNFKLADNGEVTQRLLAAEWPSVKTWNLPQLASASVTR